MPPKRAKRKPVSEEDEDSSDEVEELEPSTPTASKSTSTSKSGKSGTTKKTGDPQPATSFSDQEVAQLRSSLLDWYDTSHRVLPWRRNLHSRRTAVAPAGPHEAEHPASPTLDAQQFAYHVWVSEIMLQQTQVTTVLPYFARWISRWPTVAALAKADMEELRHVWAGLGYYRRAKYLLDGARHVMDNLGGKFPETAAGLLGIPGVGPYTSAAIGSIAFNDRAAVVDGNVIRVLARLRALSGDPQRLMPTFNALATQLLDPQRPGDFNQAIMELGATVCRPKNPDCGACPANHSCQAFAEWKAYCRAQGLPESQPAYPVTTAATGGSKASSKASPAKKPAKGKGKGKAAEEEEEEEADEEGAIEDAGGALPYVTRFPSKKEAKEKRQQSLAVVVLEVLHPKKKAPGADANGTADGTEATAATSSAGSAAGPSSSSAGPPPSSSTSATAAQPAKKRQRSMLDYAGGAGAPAPSAAEPTAGSGGVKGDARGVPLRGMERRYLMVQRPEGSGLLAGLWEFPGMLLEPGQEDSYKARKAHAGGILQGALGPGFRVPGLTDAGTGREGAQEERGREGGQGKAAATHSSPGGARLVNREDVGVHVHTFSHIRQTNYVEVVRVAVDDLAAFERALESAQSSGQAPEQGEGSGSQPAIQSGQGKKGRGAVQQQGQGGKPRLQWLSEAEMLAACKGGRSNKAGGGLGVVGLSTGPRKIFGLLSKGA